MYLHLGQNEIVSDHRVIGIFDLDKCSYGKRTRDYLAAAEQEGVVLDISGDIPKSFVVCDHPYHPQIVYLSQLNTSTLQKRAESEKLEFHQKVHEGYRLVCDLFPERIKVVDGTQSIEEVHRQCLYHVMELLDVR